MIELTEEEYQEHVDSDDGLCLYCHEFTYGDVEPDAIDYYCDYCGNYKVVGTEEALLMGQIDIVE